eukprot:6228934-Karenia_brevis.AAC.1
MVPLQRKNEDLGEMLEEECLQPKKRPASVIEWPAGVLKRPASVKKWPAGVLPRPASALKNASESEDVEPQAKKGAAE